MTVAIMEAIDNFSDNESDICTDINVRSECTASVVNGKILKTNEFDD